MYTHAIVERCFFCWSPCLRHTAVFSGGLHVGVVKLSCGGFVRSPYLGIERACFCDVVCSGTFCDRIALPISAMRLGLMLGPTTFLGWGGCDRLQPPFSFIFFLFANLRLRKARQLSGLGVCRPDPVVVVVRPQACRQRPLGVLVLLYLRLSFGCRFLFVFAFGEFGIGLDSEGSSSSLAAKMWGLLLVPSGRPSAGRAGAAAPFGTFGISGISGTAGAASAVPRHFFAMRQFED